MKGRKCLEIEYASLKEKLQKSEFYEAVNLREFAPDDRRAQYMYYQHIRLPFPIEVFERCIGSRQEKHVIGWRVPDNKDEQNLSKSIKMCYEFEKNLPMSNMPMPRTGWNKCIPFLHGNIVLESC